LLKEVGYFALFQYILVKDYFTTGLMQVALRQCCEPEAGELELSGDQVPINNGADSGVVG
jgi:hypothetical protein